MKTNFHRGASNAAFSPKNILFFLLLLTFYGHGQVSPTSQIGLYVWREEVFITPCSVTGDSIGVPITSKSGQKFRVLQVNGNSAIIKVLDYTMEKGKDSLVARDEFFRYNYRGTTAQYKQLSKEDVNARDYGANQAYFKVPISLVEAWASKENKIGGSLAAGVINFPFKYRPQKNNSDFSGAFNFGAGIGYTFPHKSSSRFVYSVLSGYSISNVVLDSSTTNKNQGQLSSTNNFTALSLSLGGMIQYGKVQAGVFIGWDRLSKINQRQFDWQYNSKPWISIGFGLAIFSEQNEQASRTNVVQQ